jgi:uncharacterized membrane protein (UPF0127 family)
VWTETLAAARDLCHLEKRVETEVEIESSLVNLCHVKLLKVSCRASLAVLSAGLLVLAGCQKSTAPISTTPVIAFAEPTEAQPKLPTVKLWIGPEQMDAEMCETPREEQTGMMFRKNMGENDGMIFNLGRAQQAGFWMENCYIPLSVAYIDSDGVIQEIHPLQPQDTNTVYSAADNIRFALETPQGWFDKHNIKPGTVIRSEKGSLLETFGQRQ